MRWYSVSVNPCGQSVPPTSCHVGPSLASMQYPMHRTTVRSLRSLSRHAQRTRCSPAPPFQPRFASDVTSRIACHRSFSAAASQTENDGEASVLVFAGIALATAYLMLERHENRPSRTNPKHLMNDSLKIVNLNEHVHQRLGSKLVSRGDVVGGGGGRTGAGLPSLSIEHVKVTDKDGKPSLRIRYNLFGPRGYASVFAEAAEDSQDGEFNFIYVQYPDTHEVVTIVDPVDTMNAWNGDA